MKLLSRFLLCGLIGALVGYVLLYPLSMLAHSKCYGPSMDPDFSYLRNAFSRDFAPLAMYFSVLGAAGGIFLGIYSHRINRLNDRLKILSMTDELTSLYNHRYFMQELDREIARSIRYSSGLSLLMIDLDHFKMYNDQNGHLQGDYLLKKFSVLLKNNIRKVDIAARYGGEEFTVIMPGAVLADAVKIAERLRQVVEKYRFAQENSQPGGNITISIGVAELQEDTTQSQNLINRADRALYDAKYKGRNRVSTNGAKRTTFYPPRLINR